MEATVFCFSDLCDHRDSFLLIHIGCLLRSNICSMLLLPALIFLASGVGLLTPCHLWWRGPPVETNSSGWLVQLLSSIVVSSCHGTTAPFRPLGLSLPFGGEGCLAGVEHITVSGMWIPCPLRHCRCSSAVTHVLGGFTVGSRSLLSCWVHGNNEVIKRQATGRINNRVPD